EATDLLDTDEDTLIGQLDANVTKDERELLQESSESMASPDDQSLRNARLDNRDNDGTLLNEKIDLSGNDLDVPGSEEEERKEDDEENEPYSLNDDKEDQTNIYQ